MAKSEQPNPGKATGNSAAAAAARVATAFKSWLAIAATLFAVFSSAFLATDPALAQKFYPDDPLEKDPPPMPVVDPERRDLAGLLEYFSNTLISRGERHPDFGIIPAGNVNTLGEMPDGPWFTNRHSRQPMSREELVRGPGNSRPPAMDEPWQVLIVKRFGDRPGILIADSTRQLYLLRFDPPDYLELATGAEMVASKFFYAIGYNVLEEYIVYFDREQLVRADGAEDISSFGESRDLLDEDIDEFLKGAARDRQRGYRAVATLVPDAVKLLGPFQLFGTRADDPNDIIPHEHHRELRGLHVFSSWLGHDGFRAVQTLDVLMENENGVHSIRHHLIDFFATLGSGEVAPKSARDGYERLYERRTALVNFVGMGIYTPGWMRADYPGYRSVGLFEAEAFEPGIWVSDEELAPFENRLPDDEYWAAKIITSFTDDDIRALVSTGQYSDPRAATWIADSLIERRDKIGEYYFSKVLPLDDFEVRNGELTFEDLAVQHGLVNPRDYSVRWFQFDNISEEMTLLGRAEGSEVPPRALQAEDGSYFAAEIWADNEEMSVTVYFRKESTGLKTVGIDRSWPGKVIADPAREPDLGYSRFAELNDRQKELIERPAQRYNEAVGRNLTPQEYFDSLTISERTTYEAVTHAIENSTLSDEEGNSLGTAFDLVADIERIAGQYYGRSGDQQFRLYVDITPDAVDILERSVEFNLGNENTVYHVGYPHSYRQEGNVPNIQFSVSEDGLRADIDVDYRSSKLPQAMFNGHLTSANSDVRAGDNHERHDNRWGGLVAWWQGLFDKFGERRDDRKGDLLSKEPPEVPTPLPPDRPMGARIDELHDAGQEFLTDMLVRRQFDEAMSFVSDRALACVNVDDDSGEEVLDTDQTRRLLRELMEAAVDELGDLDNLTEAMDPIIPWHPTTRILEHPYQDDFTVVEMTNTRAEKFLCNERRGARQPAPGEAAPEEAAAAPQAAAEDEYGTYYAIGFRFKVARDAGGVLGFLWAREEGVWKIVSWQVFEQ